jgi:hypothetical protein
LQQLLAILSFRERKLRFGHRGPVSSWRRLLLSSA